MPELRKNKVTYETEEKWIEVTEQEYEFLCTLLEMAHGVNRAYFQEHNGDPRKGRGLNLIIGGFNIPYIRNPAARE